MSRTTKQQQREATTARLIEIAHDIFTRDGYAAAATDDIVQLAGVTRGALYHHFGSKEGLFRAVLEAVQQDVGRRVDAAANAYADPWMQLKAGCAAYLEASCDPQVQRVMLVDAPSVLGWAQWREIDAQFSMKALREGISALIDARQIALLPIDALTHLLSGAMNEAALWIAGSSAPAQALAEATTTLDHLLESLRAR